MVPMIYDLCDPPSKTTDTPRLLDEAEQKRQLEARQAEIAAYRAYREQVEARREMDRQDRNLAKVKQLELFEEMQVKESYFHRPIIACLSKGLSCSALTSQLYLLYIEMLTGACTYIINDFRILFSFMHWNSLFSLYNSSLNEVSLSVMFLTVIMSMVTTNISHCFVVLYW